MLRVRGESATDYCVGNGRELCREGRPGRVGFRTLSLNPSTPMFGAATAVGFEKSCGGSGAAVGHPRFASKPAVPPVEQRLAKRATVLCCVLELTVRDGDASYARCGLAVIVMVQG